MSWQRNAMQLSAAGLITLATVEGYRAEPYYDGAGVATDGFGNTVDVVMGKARGLVQDLKMLLANTKHAENAVNRCVNVPMTQSQFDGLTLFTYNVGSGAFCSSTLVKKLNAGDRVGGCSEITRWTFITREGRKLNCAIPGNKKFCGGLVTRRQEEKNLCLS